MSSGSSEAVTIPYHTTAATGEVDQIDGTKSQVFIVIVIVVITAKIRDSDRRKLHHIKSSMLGPCSWE
jgi:hypothetical protein